MLNRCSLQTDKKQMHEQKKLKAPNKEIKAAIYLYPLAWTCHDHQILLVHQRHSYPQALPVLFLEIQVWQALFLSMDSRRLERSQ